MLGIMTSDLNGCDVFRGGVVTYVVIACIFMSSTGMVYIENASIVVAVIVTAYMIMSCIVMAYIGLT